jgi:hypothetical protein
MWHDDREGLNNTGGRTAGDDRRGESKMTTQPARDSNLRATLRQAAKMGRGGDDRIAHINGYEAAILKALGGEGSINPDTGIVQFKYGGAGVSEGMNDKEGTFGGGGGFGGGQGGGGFGGNNKVSTSDYMAGKLSGWKKDPTTGGWSNPGFDKQAGIGQGGNGGSTFNGANVPGNTSAPGYLDYDSQQTTLPNGQRVSVGELRNDYHDYAGLGDTLADKIGNFIAGAFGFSEDNPFDDGDYGKPGNPTGTGANWSFDPVPAIVGLGSTLAGIPAGPGYIAGLISNELGKPLSVDLGPSVLSSDIVDESGQVVGNSKTHTGGSMTVHDSDSPDTFYGVSPGLGLLGSGASNAAPTRSTVYGADPAAPAPGPIPEQPAPELPEGVGAPAPIDAGNVSVDPGNSQLTESQLTDLFLNFVGPRSYRGRQRQTVVT